MNRIAHLAFDAEISQGDIGVELNRRVRVFRINQIQTDLDFAGRHFVYT